MVYFHCKFLCVDIEKASDHVDWSLLLTVMQKMGWVDQMVYFHCKFMCVG